MATKSISQLDTQATANETDLFEVAIVDANSASGYASKKESAAAIADAIVGAYQYPLRITGTTAKTIAGAINELKNLVDLLPQFAIEVVQTLPVSDISETTIYLVPAQDPEQGNYYEEYIYVNNAWELVGTTAVDLSGYYTSAQVDTLLAAKANTSSLATVATSGAYSDLTGKPTIDTALDTTSTNAVENRAVASEINSIKSDIAVDGSASGDIASFADGSDNPLKALKISIVATQSGTGDPSPTNPRPISGWTGCNVWRTGVNIWDEEWEAGDISTNTGANGIQPTRSRSKNYIPIVPTEAYFCCGTANMYLFFYDKDKRYLGYHGSTRVNKVVIPANLENTKDSSVSFTSAKYMRFRYDASTLANVSINHPSTDHEYHAYTGNTYPISWETEAGTVYGGTLNVKTGELTVTHGVLDLGDLSWVYTTLFYAYSPANSFALTSGDLTKKLMCSCYKVISGTAPSNPNKMITMNNSATGSSKVIRVYDTDYTDATTFKTAVTGQKLVYELATPITYQLTPTEIRSLLGINNVWADCGAITELKYTRDLNLCINDIIARIEALEGASSNRSLSVSPVLTKSLTSDSDTTEGKTEETEEETKEEAQKNEK